MTSASPPRPSLLDQISIQNPCTADWTAMRGDDRVRRCGDCKLNVYNVAAMSPGDAEALITASEGERVCMRLSVRPDGTVVTAECLTTAQRLRRRMQFIAAAFIGLLGLGTATVAAQATESGGLNSWQTWEKQPFKSVSKVLPQEWVPQEPPSRVLMGVVCPPSRPPSATPIVPQSGDRDGNSDGNGDGG